MLQAQELLQLTSMPHWRDISLPLYKEFAEIYLIPTTFRYYLENDTVLDVKFTECSIYHMLAIQHIDGKISRENFFDEIDKGLDFGYFTQNTRFRRRFNDFKHRIRMFACCYQILRNQELFYVHEREIPGTSIKADYIKYALIDQKGVNIGIRYIDGEYIASTLLIDRSINPIETITGLKQIHVLRLEIIRDGKVIETVNYI